LVVDSWNIHLFKAIFMHTNTHTRRKGMQKGRKKKKKQAEGCCAWISFFHCSYYA